jgi:hypothetical protein
MLAQFFVVGSNDVIAMMMLCKIKRLLYNFESVFFDIPRDITRLFTLNK